ncbi:MAG: T9SS type A sorting domain-containing protein [Candidatus Electryonea clarkiae]|nr:T9SS type A sorting domain-containing protein [Candidatus Electryonea clarkiae]MDP8288682.1 T9SS type A sorting domain-containing protein [Candidatus Electryonea clarkiae]
MKQIGLVVLVLLFAFSTVFATGAVSPYQSSSHTDRYISINEDIQLPDYIPGFQPIPGELDEIMGDTVIVGFTYWESQHNGTVGRMLGHFDGEISIRNTDLDGAVFQVWTCLENGVETADRHVRFNRTGWDGDGSPVVEFERGNPISTVDAGDKAGYTTMGFDSENGLAFPVYHGNAGVGGDYHAQIATELINLFPGVFNETAIPDFESNVNIWPKSVYTVYDDQAYLHAVTHENRVILNGPMDILYSRNAFDLASNSFTVAESQVLVTDEGMNIAADIAASDDGSIIAIATTVSMDIIQHPGTDTSQWNNGVYLWTSDDGGETWDWDSPIDVTSWIRPDSSYLPDSVMADQDTLRNYTDVNVYIDHDDVIHVAFTTHNFFHYEGTISRNNDLYHWDNDNYNVTKLANGRYWNWTLNGAWQLQVQRPNMYQDPATGILWCVFQQYGMPGEYTETDSAAYGWDASDNNLASGEIMVCASPPSNELGDWYGQLWSKPVNITNTRRNTDPGPDNGHVAGDCRNEREPSLSLTNNGEYLHISYVLDLDAGFMQQPDEGDYTNNPVVYHRVSKSALLDAITDPETWAPWIGDDDLETGWVINTPMHIDETGFWEDSYFYAWEDADWEEFDPFFRGSFDVVRDKDQLLPGEFSLEQNYPNPFNPVTHISFNLKRQGVVKLAVFDILGREIATLVNRKMEFGRHTVGFDGENLASGMYFVKLSSGENTKTIKMVLMK